ncbi:XPG domain containing-domain-containing protein [Phaeosphaeriaceae sp. PMI808]|nr:XPG domain containing-domain-containing protein [Phaeosphaeriaceae sp. PMI808]
MGIQGLAKRLEPYASRHSAQQLQDYTAVIDGPGLAYEAHKLALRAAATQSRIPSYQDVNDEAIRWLNSLEEQGIKVLKIVFDGALPESKRVERLSRTEQNNRRVQQLRKSYASAACPIPTYLGSTSYAFLAPSLREALAESSFAGRTQIVPGEADDSCALLAKDTPCPIIFTCDTDLLLYDYNSKTLITFFHDAETLAEFKAYSPHEITKKLELVSLLPFAHAIQNRISEIQGDLIRDARSTDVDSSTYVDFSKRYTGVVVTPSYLGRHVGLSLRSQDLDVRVSEFVHQAFDGTSDPHVYLPLLVEDPNQASAWNMAQDVRTIAYSLLVPSQSTVKEFRRKAQGISLQEINPHVATNISVSTKELGKRISALLEWAKAKEISPPLLWSLFALSLLLSELNTPPPITLLLRILNGDFDNTWDFIQLTARLQAAMYSLRMLKQITAIWLVTAQQTGTDLHNTLSNLHEQMSNFPSISEVLIVLGQEKRVLANSESLRVLVEEVFTSTGVGIPVEQVWNKKKRKQAREAERKKRRN